MKRTPLIVFTLLLCVYLGAPQAAFSQEESLPAGFRFVGNYRVVKRVKIRDGSPFSVVTKQMNCRVYTDGISVRVYGETEVGGFTSFNIYRNDGIIVETSRVARDVMPGLQASTQVGDVMRQLTLTEERLVLTKFPALSDIVEVTYANRQITLRRN